MERETRTPVLFVNVVLSQLALPIKLPMTDAGEPCEVTDASSVNYSTEGLSSP